MSHQDICPIKLSSTTLFLYMYCHRGYCLIIHYVLNIDLKHHTTQSTPKGASSHLYCLDHKCYRKFSLLLVPPWCIPICHSLFLYVSFSFLNFQLFSFFFTKLVKCVIFLWCFCKNLLVKNQLHLGCIWYMHEIPKMSNQELQPKYSTNLASYGQYAT